MWKGEKMLNFQIGILKAENVHYICSFIRVSDMVFWPRIPFYAPCDCWSAAIASMGEIDSGPAAAKRLFYDLGYDKKVCPLAGSSTLYEWHCDSHHTSCPIAREAYQLYQERVCRKVQGLPRAILFLTGEKICCSQRRPLCLPRRPCECRLYWKVLVYVTHPAGCPCKYRPRLPKQPDPRDPQAGVVWWSRHPPETLPTRAIQTREHRWIHRNARNVGRIRRNTCEFTSFPMSCHHDWCRNRSMVSSAATSCLTMRGKAGSSQPMVTRRLTSSTSSPWSTSRIRMKQGIRSYSRPSTEMPGERTSAIVRISSWPRFHQWNGWTRGSSYCRPGRDEPRRYVSNVWLNTGGGQRVEAS